MIHIIALVLALILWTPSPGRDRHNQPARRAHASAKPTQPTNAALTPAARVICAPTRPVTLLDLADTLPPPRLVPQYLIQWEQTPEAERQAILARQAEEAWPRWLKITTAETARSEKTAQIQRRRVELFAAAYELPDPYGWLDDVTGAAGALLGVGAGCR